MLSLISYKKYQDSKIRNIPTQKKHDQLKPRVSSNLLNRFIPDGEHREYVVPKSCENGTIDWNYPKEFIIIHFRRETHLKYSVSLGDSIGGNMFTLFDITGNIRQPILKGLCTLVTEKPIQLPFPLIRSDKKP